MTTTAAIKAGQFSSPTLSKDGRTMTVRIPITLRHQGGRKQVVTPAGAAPANSGLFCSLRGGTSGLGTAWLTWEDSNFQFEKWL